MRILLTLAYDGTRYAGWQLQGPQQTKPTIQGAAEAALFTLTGQKIRLHGAGRTDAGAHALGQRAHFDIAENPGRLNWQKALNAVLPHDIRIAAVQPAPDDFHARNSAISKIYHYYFWTEPAWQPPYLRHMLWNCGHVDADLMRQALPVFLGRHDFASFQNAGTDLKSTVREIYSINLEDPDCFGPQIPKGSLLRLEITGNGFLKQMTRNIAGFLRHIGAGKISPETAGSFLLKANRQALPSPTAPARGLFLARVNYGRMDSPSP